MDCAKPLPVREYEAIIHGQTVTVKVYPYFGEGRQFEWTVKPLTWSKNKQGHAEIDDMYFYT